MQSWQAAGDGTIPGFVSTDINMVIPQNDLISFIIFIIKLYSNYHFCGKGDYELPGFGAYTL